MNSTLVRLSNGDCHEQFSRQNTQFCRAWHCPLQEVVFTGTPNVIGFGKEGMVPQLWRLFTRGAFTGQIKIITNRAKLIYQGIVFATGYFYLANEFSNLAFTASKCLMNLSISGSYPYLISLNAFWPASMNMYKGCALKPNLVIS